MTCSVCLLDIAGRIVILLKQLKTLDTGHWTPGLIHQSVLEAYLLYNSAMPGQVDVAMLVSIYCTFIVLPPSLNTFPVCTFHVCQHTFDR